MSGKHWAGHAGSPAIVHEHQLEVAPRLPGWWCLGGGVSERVLRSSGLWVRMWNNRRWQPSVRHRILKSAIDGLLHDLLGHMRRDVLGELCAESKQEFVRAGILSGKHGISV